MEPRIVERAEKAPGQCLFSQDIDGPFIDTGCWAHWVDPYGYLSVAYVESLARDLLGMVPRSEVEKLQEDFAALETQYAEMRAMLDALGEYEEMRGKVAA